MAGWPAPNKGRAWALTGAAATFQHVGMERSLEPLALLVKQVQHLQNRKMAASLEPLGVSLAQWNAMREIDRHPGASLRKLAEASFNSDQAFGTLVARLERLGMVVQRPGKGRALVTELTDAGERVLHAGYPAIMGVCAKLLGALGEAECGLLEGLLNKVLGAAEP